mmetsp:Transcript_104570/g.168277  ORF Transcript_104570/g.168277 Transcript_104570/m.168277 type:complete len:612 (+) Transcript_104570:333-2168(+)
MPNTANEECRAVQVARAFFQASTKLSDDNEDILPQEDGVDQKLSVFHLFSELFPEYANDKDRDGGNTGKSGLMRLQFNKIGYEMYDKEQSRRVPAVRAKPGNPGYGFRRARWRDTMVNGEDRRACETVLRTLGVSQERLDRIRQRISDFREEWNNVRRPSRPAGPGRPRGHKRANPSDPMESIDPLPELTGVLPMLSQGAGLVMGLVGGHGAIVRKVPKKQPCKSKINAAAAKGAAGVAHNGAGAASGLSGAGCLPGDLHNGRWQHPQGADSPEDYVLQSSQSDAAHGPVAAIIIEDEKSGLWHNSYQEWDESTPAGHGGGGNYEEEEESKHVHNLMDENSSLRSLNMSLIYEREKLLRELRQCDSEMVGMQRAVDGLLQTNGKGENTAALCQGFGWLCQKLIRKARSHSTDNQEIPPHLRQVLEACFDKYDEFQRQGQLANGDDCDRFGMSGARQLGHDSLPPLSCLPSSSGADTAQQQLRDFNELAVSKNGSPSEDLREELSIRGLPGARRLAGVKEESRQRPSDSPDATLGEGTEGMGSSPSFGSKEHKHQRLVPISESKTADSDPEPVWASGGVLGESDVEMYDGDIGEVGNYDYLFSSHCPTTTAF